MRMGLLAAGIGAALAVGVGSAGPVSRVTSGARGLLVRATVLLSGLLLAALALTVAPAARAVTCSSTQFVTWDTEFTDCAGNQNFLNATGTTEHSGTVDGPSVANDWFSDLHIDFPDPQVQGVSVNGGLFFKEVPQGALYWNVEGTLFNDIAFVAPSVAGRINPGDVYDWAVFPNGDFSGLNGLNIYVEYTMDVPEPGTLALVPGALLAFTFAARRRRSD